MTKKLRHMPIALTLTTLGVALSFAPVSVSRAQSEDRSVFDTRQHGYAHGYRDGYEYGRDARERNVDLDFRTDAYRSAEHGYQPIFGAVEEYRDGYRQGYRNGAEDGYNGVRSRLAQVFGWQEKGFDPDGGRDDRSADAYRDRHWNYEDVANDIGYRDGVTAGLKDYSEHHSFRPEKHDAWKDAEHGYSKAFGSKDEYRRAYRVAYEAGYRDGFGARTR